MIPVPTRRTRHAALASLLLACAVALSILPSAATSTPAAAALSSSVNFDDIIRELSPSSVKAYFPTAVVDSNNHTHIVYGDADANDLKYINNVSGSWSAPVRIDGGVKENRDPFFWLAVGPDNTLHLVYASTGDSNPVVYHRRGTIQGTRVDWPRGDKTAVSGGAKSFAPVVAVDGAGTAHIAWINNACGEYTVAYRVRRADGSMNGESRPIGGGCRFQNRPQIAVTNDGKVHLVYQDGRDISYSRREPSAWANQNVSSDSSTNSSNATIATDGVGLYVAWGEGIASGNHDIRFRYSSNGGEQWSTRIDISNTPQYAQFPNVNFSKAANRAYIVWSDVTGSTDTTGDIYFREFDPRSGQTGDADRVIRRGGDSNLPVVAVGPGLVDIVWQDRAGDNTFTVFETAGRIIGGGGGGGPTPTPVPVGCDVTVTAPPQTNGNNVTLTLAPASGCTPTQMQVTVDAAPTDATPKVAYSANPSVPVPAADACGRTFYVRLFDAAGVGGKVATAVTKVATKVNATLITGNPRMPLARGTFSTMDLLSDGAFNGDPNYTRVKQIYVEVLPASDCIPLKNIQIGSAAPTPIPTAGLRMLMGVPDFEAGPGSYAVVFRITDQLDNVLTVDRRYVYDPGALENAPSGLPVLQSGTVSGPATSNSVMTTLTFSNVSVDDNLYGNATGLPAIEPGQRFWGAWVASSRTENAAEDQLNWTPVAVPNRQCTGRTCNFTLQWSLFSNLGYNPTDATRTGNYYVFVKFLDGAGNPTTQTIKTSAINLQQGYTVPTQYFPYTWR